MERLRLALHNKKGMTLIEIMIALMLLAIVSLAVMQTALVGMRANLQNSVRDEGVSIADLRMNELRDLPFDSIVTDNTGTTRSRVFRAATWTYTETHNVTPVGSKNDTKQIDMKVSWPFPISGPTYTHNVTTIVRRQ